MADLTINIVECYGDVYLVEIEAIGVNHSEEWYQVMTKEEMERIEKNPRVSVERWC